jgi:2-oxoglutarate ferredoxin oxidoreductase subunit alpha
MIVLAPASVQEMADFVFDGFALAEKYRTPVMILSDGALGQMMEKVVLKPEGSLPYPEKPWATTGKLKSRERNFITTLHMESESMEAVNNRLQAKYAEIQKEVRYQLIGAEDADVLLVAFGLTARICSKAAEMAREKGINAAVLRPITLYPFPSDAIARCAKHAAGVLTVEMNAGQMVEDVRLAVNGATPVHFKGRSGGMIPSPEEILVEIEAIAKHTIHA